MTEEDLEFLAGGGAAGAAARALDWRESPLGPPRLWSPALRQAARMALGSPMPLLFYWGPRNACLFNDGSAAMMGPERAGSAMGRPGAEVWGAAWEAIEPDVASILAGGPALTHVDRLVPIERGGRVEQTHWTYSHIPVRDESAPLCVGGVMVVATETTQKVLADARVERELARQRALFEQMPGFVGVVEGPAHSYAYVNAAYREISGPRDFIGRSAREVFPELAGQGFFELLDAVFASGERHVARGVPVTLSGEPRQKFIDFLYEPIRGEDGAIRGVFIGGYDATDAARAHQDLRAAQTQLLAANADLARESSERADAVRRVWEASPDLLSVLDGEGRFERANPAWGALLGWEPAELEGASLRELAHPLDAPTIDAAFSALRSGQPAASFEARLRREAGGHLWTSWAAAPDGKSIHCAARDVDADRRARSDRDLIWRHTREAIVAIDERGLMVAVNPACREALGYELSEMLGRHVLDFVHPDDHPPTTPLGGMPPERYAKPRIFENRWLRKEGGLRHMSWIASIAEDGRVYASGRDTTEERDRARALASAEERLRQAQKMEAVGQLTGGLAHDFNNLLMAISGNLQVMQVRLSQGRSAETSKQVESALAGVKRAAALTHRLLAFSRRQTLDPQPVDAAALVAGMDDLIRRSVGPSISVSTSAEPGLWAPLADANQLENAILNLCINARDAQPDGGAIRVLLANRALDAAAAAELDVPPGRYVLAEVGDDGAGMRPEVAAKAFEPFFTTKPLGLGTGLGLSMIYGFARQSGGQARIGSEPGGGARVSLWLPASPEGGAAPRPQAEPGERGASGAGARALVVDDEPAVRELVAGALREAGFEIFEAPDGPGALEALAAMGAVDLLVTDVGLPGGMNGRQLADAAMASRPGLGVIFITGYAEGAALSDGALGERMSVMTKPFELAALATKAAAMTRLSKPPRS